MSTLIASFFVVSPLLILYTAGFRYDWKSGQWQSTGVISIDTEPADAEVYLNNVRWKQKQPIRLAGLAPGIYHLQIKKPGYLNWQKDLTVASNQTTYIKDVRLFKEIPPSELTVAGKVLELVTLEDEDGLLVLTSTTTEWQVKLLNLKSGADEVLLSWPRVQTRPSQPPVLTVSPTRSEVALIATDSAGAKLLTVINLAKPKFFKTIKYPAGTVFHYQWTTRRSGDLYVASGRQFQHLAAGEPPRPLAPLDSDVWFWRDDRDVWIVEGNTLRHSQFGHPDQIFAFSSAPRLIIDASDKRLILQTDNGTKVFQVGEGLGDMAALSATEFFYEKNTSQWLAWSPWELSRIYENGDVALLRRSGEPIAAVRPLDNFGAVLLASDTTLTAFNPGYNISHELWRGESIHLFEVDAKNRRIYFTQKKDGADRLMNLEY